MARCSGGYGAHLCPRRAAVRAALSVPGQPPHEVRLLCCSCLQEWRYELGDWPWSSNRGLLEELELAVEALA